LRILVRLRLNAGTYGNKIAFPVDRMDIRSTMRMKEAGATTSEEPTKASFAVLNY